MRLLVLCPYLPVPPDHGGRIRSGVLIASLRRLGDIDVAAPISAAETSRHRADIEAAGFRVHALPGRPTTTSVVRKLGSWMLRRSELLERRWSSDARLRVRELVGSGDYDAVVVDSTFGLPLLSRRLDTPFVLHLHNVESAIFARMSQAVAGARDSLVRRVESRLIERLEASAAQRALLTLTVSDLDAEAVMRFAPRARCAVVPNSVDVTRLARLAPGRADPDNLRLLFVGSFSYPPNVEAVRELLLVHLPVLRREFPALQLEIVGRDDGQVVEQLVEAVEGVRYLGYVADLIEPYARATAVYIPLRSGGGTRIKAVEAFALGRPVISTAVGIEGLAVDEGKHYLSCETPELGVAALRRIVADDVTPIVDAARQLAEDRYDHQVAIAAIADHVSRALGR